MRKLKLFPSPHVEVIVHVSEQMEQDMKECWKKAFERGKECDTCSWKDVELFDIGMCDLSAVTNKVLGDGRRIRRYTESVRGEGDK